MGETACLPRTITGFAESPHSLKKLMVDGTSQLLRPGETQTNQRAERPAGGNRGISD